MTSGVGLFPVELVEKQRLCPTFRRFYKRTQAFAQQFFQRTALLEPPV